MSEQLDPLVTHECSSMDDTRHGDREDSENNPIYIPRRTRSALEVGSQPPADMASSTSHFAHSLPHATALPALLGERFHSRRPRSTQMGTAPGQLGAADIGSEVVVPLSGCAALRLRLHTLSQDVMKALHPFLPTTRVVPVSEPLVPDVVTNVLLESSRLLSVVPAAFGIFVNAWCFRFPPGYSPVYGSLDHYHLTPERTIEGSGRSCLPDRGDYFIAVLWALLTAYQCFQLTTGLLRRWRIYYCTTSTLVRLLALQAICWPATHLTLDIIGSLGMNAIASFGHLTILECGLLRWTTARPDVCWAVIGTTTCVSRSIQIWATSNLVSSSNSGSGADLTSGSPDRPRPGGGAAREEARKLGARTWDWGIVMRVCMIPAGCLYFVMTWIVVFRREFGGC